MADFPRIKWLNVDGQQVPFTEPQHFTGNGDETVRTGKDNPLPVANYTQDENGIWLPVSKDNPLPTQVTGSNVEVIKEYMAEPVLNTRNFFVGDFITDNVRSLRGINVSHYSMISIFIRNNTPEEVSINNAYFGTERNVPDEGGSLTERVGIYLPAGAEIWLNEYSDADISKHLKELMFPYFGIALYNSDGMSSGSFDVVIVGRKY